MRLTVTHLIAAGMPAWDIAKFRMEWPDGCDITPENYRRAEKIGLSPHTLFAAVCPSQEAHAAWYKTYNTYQRIAEIEREAKASIEAIRRQVDEEQIAARCNLLIAALKGTQ